MKLPEQINTERLVLRQSALEDADFYFACGTDPRVNKYMSWLAPKDISEVQQMLESMNQNWTKEISFNYTILRKSDGSRIGAIEPILSEFEASIGYVITPENWSKGYATEAMTNLRNKLFENPKLRRFWTVCDLENLASARVMQKCGMQLEGILRSWRPSPNISNEPRDVFCYSIVRL